jgi:hypothetical protein
MSQLVLEVFDEMIDALRLSPDEFGEELLMAAVGLAGVPRAVFLSRLGDYGVDAFRLGEEDLRQETRLA